MHLTIALSASDPTSVPLLVPRSPASAPPVLTPSPSACSGFEESRQNRVKLQEMDPAALEALVDYIYSAEIRVTENNVQVTSR